MSTKINNKCPGLIARDICCSFTKQPRLFMFIVITIAVELHNSQCYNGKAFI